MADIYEYRLIFEHEKQPLDLVVHNIPNASSDDIYSIVIELGNFLKGDDGLPGPQGPMPPMDDYRKAAEQDEIDAGKVDKIVGKGLSKNDYTDEDKGKVASAIQPEDTATEDTAGLVKPDGSTITVDEDGTLHAVGGGGSSDHRELEHRDAANQHPISSITGLQDALDGKQPSGGYALTEELDALADVVEGIEGKIPDQASTTNQLADKAFVNSSIATNTAYFRGTYDVVDDLHLTFDATEAQVAAALASVITEVTNNDYVFVVFVDTTTELPTRYDRYKYGTQDNEWQYEYTLNNSSFTANEWAAIQSGITSGLVVKLNALPDAASLAAALLAKYEKPSSGIPESDLSSGVQTKLNTKDVLVVEYGVTTYQQITDAIDAGKHPICLYNGILYAIYRKEGLNATLCACYGNYISVVKISTSNVWSIQSTTLQTVANKVTSLSSASTDTQYPSAKAVYDALQANDKVFVAIYGTTTQQEIKDAYTAGKHIVCYYNNKVYSCYVLLGSTVYLTTVVTNNSYYVTINSSDRWGNGSFQLQSTNNLQTSMPATPDDTHYLSTKGVYDFVTAQVGDIESLLAAL